MPIIVNLDVMMARRKMSLNELSEKVDITISNLSILKTGKAKAIRLSTLEAICKTLDCQPAIYWNTGMLINHYFQLQLSISMKKIQWGNYWLRRCDRSKKRSCV